MRLTPAADELFGSPGTPRVAVVGAGFGGLAMGVKLKQAGIGTFTIYESSLAIGGTWWDNTYPGAEVDVGSHLYRFSFKPHEWSRSAPWEVKPRFEEKWCRWLQSRMKGTSLTMANNYFKSATWTVVTQWPYGNVQYRVLTKLLGRVSETARRRSR